MADRFYTSLAQAVAPYEAEANDGKNPVPNALEELRAWAIEDMAALADFIEERPDLKHKPILGVERGSPHAWKYEHDGYDWAIGATTTSDKRRGAGSIPAGAATSFSASPVSS